MTRLGAADARAPTLPLAPGRHADCGCGRRACVVNSDCSGARTVRRREAATLRCCSGCGPTAAPGTRQRPWPKLGKPPAMRCMPGSNSRTHEACGQPVVQTHGQRCSMHSTITSTTSSRMVHAHEMMNTGIQRFLFAFLFCHILIRIPIDLALPVEATIPIPVARERTPLKKWTWRLIIIMISNIQILYMFLTDCLCSAAHRRG